MTKAQSQFLRPSTRVRITILLIATAIVAAMLQLGDSSRPAAAAGSVGVYSGNETVAGSGENDRQAVELGARIQVGVPGSITAIRFYKTTGNTGAHTGTLWASDGSVLATTTFTAETASGWQTANLSKAVAVTPGRTYVVSYHTNTGYYAQSLGAFSGGKTLGNSTIWATAGVYNYGPDSRFPTDSWRDSAYYVDALFTADGSTPAPTSAKPTSSPSSTPTSTSPSATATPPSTGDPVGLYAGTETVAGKGENDAKSVELGVRIEVGVPGSITAIRFYKTSGNTGAHTGTLWNSSGQALTTVSFTGETATGWQTAKLSNPVAVVPGQSYVVSYHTNVGYYAQQTGVFSNGQTLGSSTIRGVAGVYRYAADTAYPTQTWQGAAYFVDALFVPSGASTPAPSPTTTAPSTSATPTPTPTKSSTSATPTPTPTTTAPSSPPASGGTNCAAAPSKCGYPDATNTGPAPGTVFTNVPGSATSGPGWQWNSTYRMVRVTGSGAVLNGLNITGSVVIDAPNVTLQNSIVTACSFDTDVVGLRGGNPGNGYNGTGARIINNRLGCDNDAQRPRSNVRDVYGGATGAMVQGNDMFGAGNCVTLEGGGVAKDNWCHDLGHVAGDHHSGFSNHGGASGVTYVHNTALLANTKTTGGGGLSGAITIYGDFARAQNVTAQDNLISGGAYTMYGGINNEDRYGQPLNVQLLSNRLVCNAWVYGPMFVRASTIVSGNYCDQTMAAVNR